MMPGFMCCSCWSVAFAVVLVCLCAVALGLRMCGARNSPPADDEENVLSVDVVSAPWGAGVVYGERVRHSKKKSHAL
jgi:hypothetical protein